MPHTHRRSQALNGESANGNETENRMTEIAEVSSLVDARHIVRIGPRKGIAGVQAIIRFENGYGASIVQGPGTYGVELAVIRFTGEGGDDWVLECDTPVTSDVIGHNTAASLAEHLADIRGLELVKEISGD